MIKTSVIPKNNSLKLAIPDNYIGKEVEVLLYLKDEVNVESKSDASITNFAGILSEEDYQSLKSHVAEARSSWNRDI